MHQLKIERSSLELFSLAAFLRQRFPLLEYLVFNNSEGAFASTKTKETSGVIVVPFALPRILDNREAMGSPT